MKNSVNRMPPKLMDKQGMREQIKVKESPEMLLHSVRLTHREIQVAQYLVAGKTSQEIADVLGIKPRTIETYVNHLKEKYGCQRRIQLIVKLFQAGFQLV